MSSNPSSGSSKPLGTTGKTILGAYMILLLTFLVYLLLKIWPTAQPDASGNLPNATIALFGTSGTFSISPEVQLILLAAIAAAIGSYVHTATSFADFVGNRRIYASWVWWYILRVFIGVALALIFYFVIRGGFLSTGAGADDVSPFGIAAVSGLVGMFSKQATDKLEEVFTTLFKPGKPESERRADQLTSPAPQILKIEPDAFPSGSGDVSLKVNGNNFALDSVVRFKGVDRSTKLIKPGQLIALIPASDLKDPGDYEINVFNPPPGGGLSNTMTLKVQ